MKAKFVLAAIVMMTSCVTQQELMAEKKLKFKELTKDICVENPHEVRLAQALYNEIINQ
jgi:hypothetical protein